MFEQALVYLLKRFLQLFVETSSECDPSTTTLKEKVHVGVWSGLVVLENLVLKNTLLDLVDVPLTLSHGSVGRLEVRIPWGNLGVDPVTIIVDKIYLLLEPKYEWNPGAADKREQAIKQAKLVAVELFANKRLANNDSSQRYSNFAKNWLLNSFINKVIDNIQLTVREVHIRYEDQLSCPTSFCVGITLASLHVQSRDDDFNFAENYSPKGHAHQQVGGAATNFPTDLMSDPPLQVELKTQGFETFHKLVQVNHLSVYWNPLVAAGLNIASCAFRGRPLKELQLLMVRTIPTPVHQATDRPRHHYILFPVDVNTFLDVSFNAGTGTAKANVRIVISELSVALEDLQLREIISLSTNMASFAKLQRFSEYRPTSSILDDPAAWWRYAIQAVMLQIRIDRSKKMRLSLRKFTQRIRDKRVYTELWMSRLVSPQSVVNQLLQLDHTCKPTADPQSFSGYQTILNEANQSRHRSRSSNPSDDDGNDDGNEEVGTEAAASRATTAVRPLDASGIELLHALEYSLPFEDIVLFRSLAEQQLSSAETTHHQSWIGGILSWLTGGAMGSHSRSGPGAMEEEKRRLLLLEALKYDDPDRVLRGGSAKEVNPGEVIAVVGLFMQRGSITLALTSPDADSGFFRGCIPFLTLELGDLRARTVVMGDGSRVKVNLSLQDFSAFEVSPTSSSLSMAGAGTGAGAGACKEQTKILFRRVMSVDDRSVDGSVTGSISSSVQRSSGGGARRHDSSSGSSSSTNPLFSMLIEVCPPNSDSDMLVQLSVEELEIWISPAALWVGSLSTFVTWPSDLQYWSEMEMASMNQFADFKAKIDAKLEYMMLNHLNIAIEANINAPVIVISDRVSREEKGDVLVIDLGLISLQTEKLAAKAHCQKLLDSQSQAAAAGFFSDSRSCTPVTKQDDDDDDDDDADEKKGGAVAITLQFSPHKLTAVREVSSSSSLASGDWEKVLDAQQVLPMDGGDRLEGEAVGAPPMDHSADSKDKESRLEEQAPREDKASTYESNHEDKASTYESNHEDKASTYDEDKASTYESSHAEYGTSPSLAVTSNNNTEDEQGTEEGEQHLYDVFVCRVSQVQVFLVSSSVIKNGSGTEIDCTKSVIVSKFELSVEIQASVLPWDTSLPPVKLLLDIPEINVQLSLQKLQRIKQFTTELISDTSTTAMLSSNLSRLQNILNSSKNSAKAAESVPSRRSLKLHQHHHHRPPLNSRLSITSHSSVISVNSSRRRRRRSQSIISCSDAVSNTSEVSDANFFDATTGRASSVTSMSLQSSSGASHRRKSDGMMAPRDSRRHSFRSIATAEERIKKLIDASYVVRSEEDAPVDERKADDNDDDDDVDDDDDDDDSFFSVEDHMDPDEFSRQKDQLQYVIAQRESMRTKLMTDIRVTEADVSKTGLHDTLKQELSICEQELQQLRVAYVELLMNSEDLLLPAALAPPATHPPPPPGTAAAAAVSNYFSEGLQLGMQAPMQQDKEAAVGDEAFGGGGAMMMPPPRRRDLAQASVFKIPSQQLQRDHNTRSNKELVLMRANILVVHVDLECSSSDTKLVNNITRKQQQQQMEKPSRRFVRMSKRAATIDPPVPAIPSSEILPAVTFRLSLSGMGFKLRHRLHDSQLSFSLQEIQVSDLISSPTSGFPDGGSTGLGSGTRIALLSSEPSHFGLFMLPTSSTRYNANGCCNELLKVKYEVFYGSGSGSSDVGGQRRDGEHGFAKEATHSIKVAFGLLGISIEQNRIALLMNTVHSSLVGMVSPSAVDEHDAHPKAGGDDLPMAKPSANVDGDFIQKRSRGGGGGVMVFPTIVVGFRIECICVSVLRCSSLNPLALLTCWSVSATYQSRARSITASLRIADVSMHYSHQQHQQHHHHHQARSDRVLVFGRDTSSTLPFLSLSLHYDKEGDSSSSDMMSVPSVTIASRTVPVHVNADMDFFYDLSLEVVKGPILEAATRMTSAPQVTSANADSSLAAAVQVQPSSSSSSPSSSMSGHLLDEILIPLLDACNGRLESVFGAIEICCTVESSSSHHRPSSSNSSSNRSSSSSSRAVPPQKQTVLLMARSIEAHVIWGDICENGALHSSIALTGASIRCGGGSDAAAVGVGVAVSAVDGLSIIMDPVDMFCKLQTLPPSYYALLAAPAATAPMDQSSSSFTEVVASLSFNTPYPPPLQRDVGKNELQLAVSISPILAHVSEGILECMTQWGNSMTLQVEKTMLLFDPIIGSCSADDCRVELMMMHVGGEEGSSSSSISSNPTGIKPFLDFDLQLEVLLYEVVVSIESSSSSGSSSSVEQPQQDRFVEEASSIIIGGGPLQSSISIHNTPRRSTRNTSSEKQSSLSAKLRVSPSKSKGLRACCHPMFRLLMSGMHVRMRVHSNADDAHHVEGGNDMQGGPLDPSPVVVAQFTMDAMHFEHMQTSLSPSSSSSCGSTAAFRRLFTTGISTPLPQGGGGGGGGGGVGGTWKQHPTGYDRDDGDANKEEEKEEDRGSSEGIDQEGHGHSDSSIDRQQLDPMVMLVDPRWVTAFIDVEVALKTDAVCTAQARVHDFHITVVSGALIDLCEVFTLYHVAMSPSQRVVGGRGTKKHHSWRVEESGSSSSSGYHAIDNTLGQSIAQPIIRPKYGHTSFAHPSSVPMAPQATDQLPSISTSIAATATGQTSHGDTDPSPIILLGKNSFALSSSSSIIIIVKQIAVAVKLSLGHIYIPSNYPPLELGGAASGPSLHLSIGASLEYSTYPISDASWSALVDNKGASTSAAAAATTHHVVSLFKGMVESMELSLMRTMPLDICYPVVSLQQSQHHAANNNASRPGPNDLIDSPSNDRFMFAAQCGGPSTSRAGSHSSSSSSSSSSAVGQRLPIKMLMFPLSAEISHSVSVCLAPISINQTTESLIHAQSSKASLSAEHSHSHEQEYSISWIDQQTEEGMVAASGGSRENVRVAQTLGLVIDSCEVQCLLDYRPLLKIFDDSIKPLLDYSSSSSSSSRVAANDGSSAADESKAMSDALDSATAAAGIAVAAKSIDPTMSFVDRKAKNGSRSSTACIRMKRGSGQVVQAHHFIDLMTLLPSLASLSVGVDVKSITLYLINDIYKQPVSVAIMNCNRLHIQATMNPLVRRDAKLLLLQDYSLPLAPPPSMPLRTKGDAAAATTARRGIFGAMRPPSVSSCVPVVSAVSSPEGNMTSDGHTAAVTLVRVEITAEVGVEYYNQRLIAREPLVEPFPCSIVVHSSTSSSSTSSSTSSGACRRHGPIITILDLNKTRSVDKNRLTISDYLSDYIARTDAATTAAAAHASSSSVPSVAPSVIAVDIDVSRPIVVNLTMPLLEIAVVTARIVNTITNDPNSPSSSSSSYVGNSSADYGATDGRWGRDGNLDVDGNAGSRPQCSNESRELSILGIRNDSGLPLKYWTTADGDSSSSSSSSQYVAPNSEAPLQVDCDFDSPSRSSTHHLSSSLGPSDDSSSSRRYSISRSINLALHDIDSDSWPAIHNIPLEGVGTRLFSISFDPPNQLAPDEGDHGSSSDACDANQVTINEVSSHYSKRKRKNQMPTLALELVSRGGNKVLIVRSTMRVFNSTKVVCHVELVSGFRSSKRQPLWKATVPPNQGISIPANLCNVLNGRFIIKPLVNLMSDVLQCNGSFWPSSHSVHPRYHDLMQQDHYFSAEIPCPDVPGLGSVGLARAPAAGQQQSHQQSDRGDSRFDQRTTTSEQTKDSSCSDDIDHSASKQLLPSNSVLWRKKLSQRRGALNTLTYSHWLTMTGLNLLEAANGFDGESSRIMQFKDMCSELSYMKSALFCNVDVTSKGMQQALAQANSAERSMLRTVTISAPVTVVNLTASEYIFAITSNLNKYGQANDLEPLLTLDSSIADLVPQAPLSPGESWDFLSAHASMDISLSMKTTRRSYGNHSTARDEWSKAVLIPGCRSSSSESSTIYSCDIPHNNGSSLSLQVEVQDRLGSRIISVFAPYWIVSISFLPLQFQHDNKQFTALSYVDRLANGSDGLAADQDVVVVAAGKGGRTQNKGLSANGSDQRNRSSSSSSSSRGLGKARGMKGIVLGPDVPIRGLVDVLNPPANGGMIRQSMKTYLQDTSSIHSLGRQDTTNTSSTVMKGTRASSYSEGNNNAVRQGENLLRTLKQCKHLSAVGDRLGGGVSNFRLIQCSYTYREKRSGRVRFRTSHLSQWSPFFSLDHESISAVTVTSAASNKETAPEDFDIARAVPHIANANGVKGSRIFSFGVMVKAAEPPFQRTQTVVIVDRFHLKNTIGHSIEVRQIGHSAVFNLRHQDCVPMWWRAGPQHLQMRLARYGWSWSGKFSIQSESEGEGEGEEVSIRLRNDFDNTVFFVLVQVVMRGPGVFVVFKGGEKQQQQHSSSSPSPSPYRFENHTLDTFKVKQRGQVTCSNLLPYHCCSYAWDEPLLPHEVTIEILRNSQQLQSQDDWGLLGSFSFDHLGVLSHPASKVDSQSRNHPLGFMSHLVLCVVAQGPTKVLQIFDRRIINRRIPETPPSSSPSLRPPSSRDEEMLPPRSVCGQIAMRSGAAAAGVMVMEVRAKIASFGVSLVDHRPQELIFIAVSGIAISHLIFQQQQTVSSIDIQRLQIDNQLLSTPYPSLLHPLLLLTESSGSDHQTVNAAAAAAADSTGSPSNLFISMSLCRDSRYHGVEYIPLLKLSVAPFDVNVDGTIVACIVEASTYVLELLQSVQSTTSHVYNSYRAQCPAYEKPAAEETTKREPVSSMDRLMAGISSPDDGLRGGLLSGSAQEEEEEDSGMLKGIMREQPQVLSLSYYDAADFVSHSPYVSSLQGQQRTLLRPSQLDSIHTLLYTLSAEKHRFKSRLAEQVAFEQKKYPSPQQHYDQASLGGAHTHPGRADAWHSPIVPPPPPPPRSPRTAATVRDHPMAPPDYRKMMMKGGGGGGGGTMARASSSGESNEFYVSNVTRINLTHMYLTRLLDSIALPVDSSKPTAKIYVERIEISEIRFNASFNPIIAGEKGEVSSFSAGESSSLLQIVFNTLMLTIGSAFAKIDNCPISFRPFRAEHVFKSANKFAAALGTHYTQQAVSQAYAVLLSSELLGNPMRLLLTLGQGIRDFLYLPTVGLFVSPRAFVVGAWRGTSSLLSNLVASLCSTGGSLASSVQVGMVNLGVVDPYTPSVASTSRHRQVDAARAVVVQRPANLLHGLGMGITLLVMDPLTGIRTDGIKGLLLGSMKGLVGIVTRPIYGTLRFTSLLLERVSFRLLPRFLADQKLRLQRSRPPRFFRHSNLPMKVYSADENVGLELLSRIHNGEFRHEGYLWHAVLKDKTIAVMTKVRMLIYSEGFDSEQLLWNCPSTSLMSLDIEYDRPTSHAQVPTPSRPDLSITMDAPAAVESMPTGAGAAAAVGSTESISDPQRVQRLFRSLSSCPLTGSPTMHIYHIPIAKSNAPNPQQLRRSINSGLRLSHKIVMFDRHTELLEFLSLALPLQRSLVTADLLTYLSDAKVDVQEAQRILMPSTKTKTGGGGGDAKRSSSHSRARVFR